jgi:hypothetical protein
MTDVLITLGIFLYIIGMIATMETLWDRDVNAGWCISISMIPIFNIVYPITYGYDNIKCEIKKIFGDNPKEELKKVFKR